MGCGGADAICHAHGRYSEPRPLRVGQAAVLRHEGREIEKALGELHTCVVSWLCPCKHMRKGCLWLKLNNAFVSSTAATPLKLYGTLSHKMEAISDSLSPIRGRRQVVQ